MDRSVKFRNHGAEPDTNLEYESLLAGSLSPWQQAPALRRQLRRMASQWLPLVLGSGGLSIPWLTLPSPAEAQLTICSRKINRHLNVAIGYTKDGQWVSEGWWKIAPSDCITPVQGDLRVRYFYIRGVEWNTGKTWAQNYSFCTDPSAFTIYGDEDCESRGYQRENFFQYDCEGKNYCNITFWPDKVSFAPSTMDKIIAGHQQGMQDLNPLQLSNLTVAITP